MLCVCLDGMNKKGDLKQVNRKYAHVRRMTPLLAVRTVSAMPMNIKIGGK